METRRAFLASAVAVGVFLCPVALSLKGQSPDGQLPQEPGREPSKDEGPNLPDPGKRILEDNDKDMKKKVERLYQLASELKEQVNKTDSSKVFSLDLMKKAEEIERLARDIKNRSKG